MLTAQGARSPIFDVGVTGPTREQRLRFDRAEITIGRVATDIILAAAGIARRHARIFVEHGQAFVEDLAGTSGTLVNGVRIAAAARVETDDRVEIGPYALSVELVLPTVRDPDRGEPIEAELLAAIARHDDDARLIYADWLEERGEATRAEFLRVQQALVAMRGEDAGFGALASRLRELAATIDAHWRQLVARPPVERCPLEFEFQCPKEWGALDTTDAASVRFCRSCHSHVFYCTDLETARGHASRGHCVAIDPVAIRPPRTPEPAPEPQPPTAGRRGLVMMGQIILSPRWRE